MLQAQFRVTRLFVVPPGAFRPAPKVESAVARLVPLGAAAAARSPTRRSSRASSRRRSGSGARRCATRCRAHLRRRRAANAAGIDPGARGETLVGRRFRAASRTLSRADPRGESAADAAASLTWYLLARMAQTLSSSRAGETEPEASSQLTGSISTSCSSTITISGDRSSVPPSGGTTRRIGAQEAERQRVEHAGERTVGRDPRQHRLHEHGDDQDPQRGLDELDHGEQREHQRDRRRPSTRRRTTTLVATSHSELREPGEQRASPSRCP